MLDTESHELEKQLTDAASGAALRRKKRAKQQNNRHPELDSGSHDLETTMDRCCIKCSMTNRKEKATKKESSFCA